jgi:hypothetical protein
MVDHCVPEAAWVTPTHRQVEVAFTDRGFRAFLERLAGDSPQYVDVVLSWDIGCEVYRCRDALFPFHILRVPAAELERFLD